MLAIKKQIIKWARQHFFIYCVEKILYLACMSGAFIIVMFVLDSVTVLDRNARMFFLALFLVLILAKAISCVLAVLKFSMPGFSEIVSEKIPGLSKHITPAIDFMYSKSIPENVSGDFIHEHLKQTDELMKKETNNRIFTEPSVSFKKYLVLCLIFSVFLVRGFAKNPEKIKRILFPFTTEFLENYLEIKPKNIRVIRGRGIDIEAYWKNFIQGSPVLKIKDSSGTWSKKEWSHADRNMFKYSIEKLTDKLTYKLSHKDIESSVYEISTRDWPGFKNIKWTVIYPGCTGKSPEVSDFVPAEADVLKGSIVQIRGNCDAELAKADLFVQNVAGVGNQMPDKFKFKQISSGQYEINFKPEKDVQYWFSLASKDELENPAPEIHKINVFYDNCPEIEILSPVFELESSPSDELKIIYAVRDDFGINSIFLERRVKINDEYAERFKTRETAKIFNKPLPLKFSDGLLANFHNLPDGAIVQFNLAASDNSMPESWHPERPRVCQSPEVRVKIKDYEKIHADSYAKIFETKLLTEKLRQHQSQMLYKLHASSGHPAGGPAASEVSPRMGGPAFSEKELKDFEDLWKYYANHTDETFQRLLSDPHFNPGLAQEFGLIKEASKHLSLNEVPAAAESMRKGEFTDSAAGHEKLKSFLDKAGKSLDKILNYQYTKDLQFKTRNLDATSGNLLNEMKEMKETNSRDEYKWKQLEEMIEKISRELAELQKILLQKERPAITEQERVFGVPVHSALRHSEMLKQAIAERNIDKALSMAKEMLEQVGKTRQAMEDFLEYKMNMSENFAEKLNHIENLWAELVQDESRALEDNTRFENSMFAKIDRKKLDFFEEMTKKQEEILKKPETGISTKTTSDIKAIYNELANKNPANAKEKINLLISSVSDMDKDLYKWIKSQEKEILDMFGNLEDETFFMDDNDLKNFQKSANYQHEITAKAVVLDSEIKKLEETLMFPPDVPKRLNAAIKEMHAAYDFLNKKDLKNAIPHQIKALEELDSGRDMLNQQVQFHKNFRKNVSRSIIPGPRISGQGQYGTDTSAVRLPDEKEYVPAVELRKKIMESLQEKYPKSQKPVIDDYLKKISE